MARLKIKMFCVPCAGQPAAALLECVQAHVELRGAGPVASTPFSQRCARCSDCQCESITIIDEWLHMRRLITIGVSSPRVADILGVHAFVTTVYAYLCCDV